MTHEEMERQIKTLRQDLGRALLDLNDLRDRLLRTGDDGQTTDDRLYRWAMRFER